MERDGYTCQICKDNKGNNLVPHHLQGFANFKELRMVVDNGITLCNECHNEFHKKYSTHNNTKIQFCEFKKEKDSFLEKLTQ
jgi:hypothetical protein